jgi:hypothetical protein
LEVDESDSPKGIRNFKERSLNRPKNRFILIESDSSEEEHLSVIPSIREESPALDLCAETTVVNKDTLETATLNQVITQAPAGFGPTMDASCEKKDSQRDESPFPLLNLKDFKPEIETTTPRTIEVFQTPANPPFPVQGIPEPEEHSLPKTNTVLQGKVVMNVSDRETIEHSVPMEIDRPVEVHDVEIGNHAMKESNDLFDTNLQQGTALSEKEEKCHRNSQQVLEGKIPAHADNADSKLRRITANDDAIMILSHSIDDEITGESLDPLLQSDMEPTALTRGQAIDIVTPSGDVCELASTIGNEVDDAKVPLNTAMNIAPNQPEAADCRLKVEVMADHNESCQNDEQTLPNLLPNDTGNLSHETSNSMSKSNEELGGLNSVVQQIMGGDSELTEIDMISEVSNTGYPLQLDHDSDATGSPLNSKMGPITNTMEAVQTETQEDDLNYDDPELLWSGFRVSRQRGCKPKPTSTPLTDTKKKSRNSKRASESPSAGSRNARRYSTGPSLPRHGLVPDDSCPTGGSHRIQDIAIQDPVDTEEAKGEDDGRVAPKIIDSSQIASETSTDVPKIDLSTAILEMDREIELEKENDMRQQIQNTNISDPKPIGKLGKSQSLVQVTPERKSSILRDANLILSESEANQSPNSSVFGTPLRPYAPDEPQTPSRRFLIKMKRPSFIANSPLNKAHSIDELYSSPEPRAASIVKFPTDSNGVPIVLSSREHKK